MSEEVAKTCNPFRKVRRLRITKNRRPGWTYLVPRRCSTPQDKWDDQIRLNRACVADSHRRADFLGRVGFRAWSERLRSSTVCVAEIADRMEACPNNPRNGGDGFDMGDGAWRDRRWGR